MHHKLWELLQFIQHRNNMKKILLVLTLLVSAPGFAQFVFGKDPLLNMEDWDKQRVHWGYFLGFSSYDFKFKYNDKYYEEHQRNEIQVKSSAGFNVGLVGNLRLIDHLDLRFEPGLYYTKRDLFFPSIAQEHPENLGLANRSVASTYIHFPLLLKFSALRTGNIRPYLVGGISSSLNLSSNYKAKDDNFEGTFRTKQWTTNYEIGIGVDLYFQYFKLTPSIRGVFGINDELIRDNRSDSPWTANIESMKTRGIFINFTFH